MNRYARQLRHYAEHYPKASSALLVAGTAISCGATVVLVDLRDRHDARRRAAARIPAKSAVLDMTPHEARLAAMLENARNSSWRENLRNAADAQARLMMPGADVDGGRGPPEYVLRIARRSEQILREENGRRARAREAERDPFRTQFWIEQ